MTEQRNKKTRSVSQASDCGNRREGLRGFTLVEMVVSMALVLLVSVAVVASIQVSYRTIRKDHVEQCAIREVENLVICFESVNLSEAVALLYGEGNAEVDSNGESVYVRFSGDGIPLAPDDESFAWSIYARKYGSPEQLSLSASYAGSDGEIYSTIVSLKQH